jgi:hypothetical protein
MPFREIALMSTGSFWFWCSGLTLASLAAFYYAFRNLFRARLIEDTPTSRIRSAPQGYVELIGEAAMMRGEPVIAPLSGTPCCWWRYVVERKHENNWRTLRRATSESLFLIRDETGECIIDPDGAMISPSDKQVWYGPSATPSAGPDIGIGTLRSNATSLFGMRISVTNTFTSDYRYTEETIIPGDPLYAIGLFSSLGESDRQAMRDDMIKERLRQWKADHANLLKRFDRNRDGQIDLDEWESVRRAAAKEVRQEQMKEDQQPIHTLSDTGSSRRPLLISTREEFEIVRRFRAYALGALAGFFVLGSAAVWMLTVRFI